MASVRERDKLKERRREKEVYIDVMLVHMLVKDVDFTCETIVAGGGDDNNNRDEITCEAIVAANNGNN